MKRTSQLTTGGLLAILTVATVSPALAGSQSDKNLMRNLAIGGAAVAGYGLLKHNTGALLLGAAGAALAGSQYEKDRKQQSQQNSYRYYYRAPQNTARERAFRAWRTHR